MVDVEVRVKKKDLLQSLKQANESAVQEHGEGEYAFSWIFSDKLLILQDDYLFIDLGDYGWISLDAKEFTAEMLVLLFGMKPELATEEVFLALLEAAGLK